MAPSAIYETPLASGRNSPKGAPKKIWNLNEPPFEGVKPIDASGYQKSDSDAAIVIDNGSFYQDICCANSY